MILGNNERMIGALTAKERSFPSAKIAEERRNANSFSHSLTFYETKASFNKKNIPDVQGDNACSVEESIVYGTGTLAIGYFAEAEGHVRVLVLDNKSDADKNYRQGLAKRVDHRDYSRQFILEKTELEQRLESTKVLYCTSREDAKDEKIIRAIAWMLEVYKNNYGREYVFAKKGNLVKYDALEKFVASPALIEEMISKVDFNRFVQMLSICGGANAMADKALATERLNAWAKAKAPFYHLFGNSLYLEEDIEIEISASEMTGLIQELNTKFPQYSFATSTISADEWIANKLDRAIDASNSWEMIKGVKKGMKVTSALATAYNDDKYNMAVSEVTQNRFIKGKLRVSIDPYDYMTMSTNQHSWQSCSIMNSGAYASAGNAYMLDNTTLIAYKTNNKDYVYSRTSAPREMKMGNFKFTGNSKSWRDLIFFDTSTTSLFVSRAHYPQYSEDLETQVKTMIVNRIRNLYPTPALEVFHIGTSGETFREFCEDSKFVYNDGYKSSKGMRGGYLIRPENSEGTPKFKLGAPTMKCVYCGRTADSTNHVSCGCK